MLMYRDVTGPSVDELLFPNWIILGRQFFYIVVISQRRGYKMSETFKRSEKKHNAANRKLSG